MRSKKCNPTAEQKRWMNTVAGFGCVATRSPVVQIHHCLGRCAKHNKVAIGNWFILPITPALHDISSNHPMNITFWKRSFEDYYGTEKHLFANMVKQIERKGLSIPPQAVLEAIEDYRK